MTTRKEARREWVRPFRAHSRTADPEDICPRLGVLLPPALGCDSATSGLCSSGKAPNQPARLIVRQEEEGAAAPSRHYPRQASCSRPTGPSLLHGQPLGPPRVRLFFPQRPERWRDPWAHFTDGTGQRLKARPKPGLTPDPHLLPARGHNADPYLLPARGHNPSPLHTHRSCLGELPHPHRRREILSKRRIMTFQIFPLWFSITVHCKTPVAPHDLPFPEQGGPGSE